MPEGPEIRRLTDYMRPYLEGHTVRAASTGVAAQRAKVEGLVGQRITQVTSRGKAIVFELDGDQSIFTHTMLYGRWYVVPRGEGPPGARKVALTLETDTHTAMLCSANRVEVMQRAELKRHKFLSELGPDVLDPDTNERTILELLQRHERTALGKLLMDQSVMAGLGNYLRSEILFLAGLRPEHTSAKLSTSQREKLAALILEVPRRSYTAQGATTSDAHIERIMAQGKDRRAARRYVYDHAGEPCPQCGTTIEETTHEGRRLFLCPRCQPS